MAQCRADQRAVKDRRSGEIKRDLNSRQKMRQSFPFGEGCFLGVRLAAHVNGENRGAMRRTA